MSNGPYTPDPPNGGYRTSGNGQRDPQQPWSQQPGYGRPDYRQPGPSDTPTADPFQEIYNPQTPGPYDVPAASPYAAPGYGQASPYAAQAAPYATSLPEHPQGVLVLILGLCSLFVGITAPVAWAIGSSARREVAAGRYAESPALTVGWVLGIIITLLMVLAVVLGVLAVLAFVVMGV